MFQTNNEDLIDILEMAHAGGLQLPDFQRDYVWGDDDVRSLIASVARGFPVGALLTLESGGAVAFKPRTLAGAPETAAVPKELLLDGQQRITSLYQSMYARTPMRTTTQHKKVVHRYYYLDINRALADTANIGDAIIGVPEDRIVRVNFGRDVALDLSCPQAEFDRDMFPLNRIFDSRDWFHDWRDSWRDRGRDVSPLERRFVDEIVKKIERYEMPIIRLDNENSREAICLVFEKVNVGGMKLDAFELLTAIYAASSFDLREDWNGAAGGPVSGRKRRMLGQDGDRRVLRGVESTDFLRAAALLYTRQRRLDREDSGAKESELPQIACNREALLGLPLDGYRAHAQAVEKGFVEAASFLSELKIMRSGDVPYPPQIVALAAAFSILGPGAHNAAARDKIAHWFWSIALGEQYGSSTESKIARDVPELVAWIAGGGPRPRALEEAIFQQDRLLSLRSRLSAAYKAIHALLMERGCGDFISGRKFEIMSFHADKVDVHHIFPQAWCKKRGIERKRFDSIVNKTPLSKRSNQIIGGDAPSVYLKRIEDRHGLSPGKLDAILESHLIEPRLLRTDDFEGFFDARLGSLSRLVGGALGKAVVTSHGTNEAETEIAGDGPDDPDAADGDAADLD